MPRLLLLIACLMATTLDVAAQIDVPDSLRSILRADTLPAEARFRQGYNLLFYNSSPEQAERLGAEVIYPFVEATWPDRSARLSRRARLELLVSFCFRERGGANSDEGERAWMERAVASAVESRDDTVCARACTAAAYMELKRGDTRRGHEYLYDAIRYYDRMQQWVMSSQMLYVIVSQFHEIRDTQGMARVLRQMEALLQLDDSKQSRYQYNVIKHSYYELLSKSRRRPDYALVDSAAIHIRENVALVEHAFDELDPHWMHGYAYYYLAKLLDDYYPTESDSIFCYLDRAEAMLEQEEISRRNEQASEKELRIHIDVVRARALQRIGRSSEAAGVMGEALGFLDELQDFDNLNDIRSQAYRFMADYYERSDPAEALKYQKLLARNEQRRYEGEKLRAINEMSAKYESEKKELQIAALTQQNRAARLTIWLSLTALVVLILLLLWNRQRRRNVEQRLWETALEAELRQTEIDALRSPERDAPIRAAIDKIVAQLAASKAICASDRQAYLDRLEALDPAVLEKSWRAVGVPLTAMELKYLICFRADIPTAAIAALMNVEPASVHTVRYRIRKKFPREIMPLL